MVRQIGKLKALAVTRAKKPGYLSDGGGLYLQVSASGSKSWVFCYRLAGRDREMGLGSLDAMPLAVARAQAAICRQQRVAGIDPIEARRRARQAAALEVAQSVTFRHCAESYIEAHQPGWKHPKHIAQWRRSLEVYAYPAIADLAVQRIDLGLVLGVLEPIWTAKPETAARVRGRVEAILDWATARGYRQGENPARWRGHLDKLLPRRSKVRRVEHFAAMPYAEIGAFMRDLAMREGIAARALTFAILTAARTSEVLGATWGEINLADKLWIVPGNRIKAGREHRVPLSEAALAIVEQMKAERAGEYLFPSVRKGKPLSNAALLMVMRRMGRAGVTTHGFRSAFRDWSAELTAFSREVSEMALAHAVADETERAYRRGDLLEKRRQIMAAWARYCAEPHREAAASVVRIGR